MSHTSADRALAVRPTTSPAVRAPKPAQVQRAAPRRSLGPIGWALILFITAGLAGLLLGLTTG